MTNLVTIQNSLAGGELSPALFGRTDLPKYKEGLSTCRNFFVDYRGGIQSRPGFLYVGTARQCGNAAAPRLIPFQFNISQGYILEFGDQYMRPIFQGAYLTEISKTISNITNANPAVLTITSHGYSVGDWIVINDVEGMTELNGLTWIVSVVVDTNNVILIDLFDAIVNTTDYNSYISGGTTSRVYTVDSPYFAEDLPYLKFTQSADVMTICCVNQQTETEYPPYDLERTATIVNGVNEWLFTEETFAATIGSPTNVTATAFSSSILSTWYSYVITAVNGVTGEESNPSQAVNIQNCDISIFQGTNSISWDAVAGATSYNIYAAIPSYGSQITAGNLYGFIGLSTGTNFNDSNIQPDFSTTPPSHFDPFSRGAITDVLPAAGGSNYSQGTISYTVHTSTGSGFSGEPIVSNGSLAGFIISNEGSLYDPADTITFSDSGGGVATGNITYSTNITVGSVYTLNGVQLSVQGENDSSLGPYQSNVGNTLAITLENMAQLLNASSNGNLTVATYTATTTELIVTYKVSGSVGNAYTLDAGATGGTTSGSNLTGGGTVGSDATATLTVGPASGTYPSVVAYYQQRRAYANSINDPDTYWMSQPGLFSNMDTSTPTTDADAVTGTPFSQQVNGIQWEIPMPGGLVILTGLGAWQVNGGSIAAITPSNQVATPQAFYGVNSTVPPLTINFDILYVQSKGAKVRDLSYNFWLQIYTGVDLTVLSNNLFDGYNLIQWAWAQEPWKLVWIVRDDGILLCLTYLKEGDVYQPTTNIYSWSRHDTNGQFVSVASVTELPNDAVYVVVKRQVNGFFRYYVEKLWYGIGQSGGVTDNCVESAISHDSALADFSNFRYPNATLYPQTAIGNNVEFLTDNSAFLSSDVGNVIRVDGGIATIVTYVSATKVLCDITQNITTLIPNDPNLTPLPSPFGDWNIAIPISEATGLNHIVGLDVSILADGNVIPNQTVTELAPGVYGVTLQEPATNVNVGLPYLCQAQTMPFDDNIQGQNVLTKRKTISAVGIVVESTRGISLGADQVDSSTQQYSANVPWVNMNEIKENNPSPGQPIPLYTGTHYKTVTAGWKVENQVAIEQSYPLPAKILAIVSYLSTGDDR